MKGKKKKSKKSPKFVLPGIIFFCHFSVKNLPPFLYRKTKYLIMIRKTVQNFDLWSLIFFHFFIYLKKVSTCKMSHFVPCFGVNLMTIFCLFATGKFALFLNAWQIRLYLIQIPFFKSSGAVAVVRRTHTWDNTASNWNRLLQKLTFFRNKGVSTPCN